MQKEGINTTPHKATDIQRKCQNCQKDFQIENEDFEFYDKMKVPAPTWCPDCRTKRRMGFYNQTNLYKRKCDGTGKMIFSSISPEYPGKVYDTSYWWSDNWGAEEYARDYDFQRNFFEQIKELALKVPKFSRSVLNLINSDYCAGASDLKNCYLLFNSGNNEDCSYGVNINDSKECLDNYNVVKGELCYGNFMIRNAYKVFYSRECYDCQDVYFSRNLKNCQNCFGCANLRNASYQIFNQQYSKEEYQKKIQEINLGSFENVQKIQEQFRGKELQLPYKFMSGNRNIDVTGNYIDNSAKVKNSFLIRDVENCKNCLAVHNGVKDCQDYILFGDNANLIYETIIAGFGGANLKFCYECYTNVNNLEYCINCMNSSDCFACVGLKNKQYHILNKPYSKEEYFQMVEKIKKHMDEMPYTDKQGRVYKYGEFFPPELSPFAYNETIAQEYFPLTKEEALKQGYKWKEREKRNYQATLKTEDIPDNISDVDNNITKEVIECATPENEREKTNCTSAFKIIPQELEFYKKMNIPLPRYCPNCRHHHRLKNRNPLKLYKRTCMKEGCDVEFETTYAPDRPEIVYCEKCYQKEVV